MAMGFSRHQALVALQHAPKVGNLVQNSVEWIFDHPGQIDNAPVRPDDEDEISPQTKAMLARQAPLDVKKKKRGGFGVMISIVCC